MKVLILDIHNPAASITICNVCRILSEFVDEDNDGLADDHQIHFYLENGEGLRYPASECKRMLISLEPSDLK